MLFCGLRSRFQKITYITYERRAWVRDRMSIRQHSSAFFLPEGSKEFFCNAMPKDPASHSSSQGKIPSVAHRWIRLPSIFFPGILAQRQIGISIPLLHPCVITQQDYVYALSVFPCFLSLILQLRILPGPPSLPDFANAKFRRKIPRSPSPPQKAPVLSPQQPVFLSRSLSLVKRVRKVTCSVVVRGIRLA